MRNKIYFIASIYIAGVFCSGFMAIPLFAQAVGFNDTSSSDLVVSYTPKNPGPREHIEVTVRSISADLSQNTITWFVKKKKITSGIGVTSVDVQVGEVGVATAIDVVVEGKNTTQIGHIAITPSIVDILIDSSSYTPPFYFGRALPSSGARVRLQAIPYLIDANGHTLPTNTLVYTWKRNGTVLGSLSGVGKNILTLNPPHLDTQYTISVDVSSIDRRTTGTGNTTVSLTDPSVEMYVDNPRLGILFSSALGSQAFIGDVESTLHIVPYFVGVPSPEDRSLEYVWKVNDALVPPERALADNITINASKSSGEADVSVAVTSSTDILLDLRRVWNIIFQNGGATGVAGSKNTPSIDPFHTAQ